MARKRQAKSHAESAPNPPLSDLEWTMLWMSLRYAVGRETIAAATLPGDILQAYYWRLNASQRAGIVQELNRHEEECIRCNGESNRAFGHPAIDRPHWLRFRAAMDAPNHFPVELTDGQTVTVFEVDGRKYPLNEYIASPQCPLYIPDSSIAKKTDKASGEVHE